MNEKCTRIPTRGIIALMIFTGTCINYTMRVNLSVNIVAMSPLTNQTTLESSESLNWSAYEKANILGAYFWGYVVSCAIGGPLSEMMGPRLIMAVTTLFSTVLTFLTPIVAKKNVVIMFALRVILGLFGGFIMPAMHVLISHWAVPAEKGIFTGTLIAGTVGTSVAWIGCGFIIEKYGWEWGFYVFGITGLVWIFAYWFLVYDTPQSHPRINESEREFIEEKMAVRRKKTVAPIMAILTSVPVWSHFLMNFGSGWGVYFVLIAVPSYIANVLGFAISSTSFLSSVTYLARSFSAFVFGIAADYLIKKNILTVRLTRVVMCFFSHILPGFLILSLSHANNTATSSIVLIIVAMAMNGAKGASVDANIHDMTTSYSGTIGGFSSAAGNIGGIVSPLVTAYFTKSNETDGELWKLVFYTGASIYIITALQFFVFGSTKRQSWDEQITKDEEAVK